MPFSVNFNPMDVVNVKADDALRLLRSGTFDVMSVQMGSVARDDPFVEGIDLVGVSTDMASLRKAVDAYRERDGPADAATLQDQDPDALALRPAGLLLLQADRLGR